MEQFIGGWKKDIPSDKDLHFGMMKAHLPSVSSTDPYAIPEYTPVSNQGGLGSCVANSSTDALEILMGIQSKNSVIQLSRLMTYWTARLLTGDQTHDDGTYVRSAFAQLSRLGVCPESMWPYIESKVLVAPPIQAFETGDSNKITSFYRIDSTDIQRLDDIEKAVRANHPVVFGTTVGSNIRTYTNGVLDIPNDAIGGHAIICVGVRPSATQIGKREFYVRNSWGTGWGLNGHCWFSEDYMMWDQTNDLWVPTLVPTLTLFKSFADVA